MVIEHESILVLGSEAEAGVEVVPETGNVGQSQIQVALPGEMSLTSHLCTHTHTHRSRHIVLLIYLSVFMFLYVCHYIHLNTKQRQNLQ